MRRLVRLSRGQHDFAGKQRIADLQHAPTIAVAIAIGAVTCVIGGVMADRIGKAEVAGGAMVISGVMAVAVALAHGGPVWLSFILILIWGAFVVPEKRRVTGPFRQGVVSK